MKYHYDEFVERYRIDAIAISDWEEEKWYRATWIEEREGRQELVGVK